MRTAVWMIVIVLLAVGGYALYLNMEQLPPPSDESVNDGTSQMERYSTSTYGISFEYPDTYELQEREVGTAQRYHYSITLIDKVALEGIPQNGEGPPTINIDIFQNNLDGLTAEQWIRGNNSSNFKLSPDGVLATTTVSGVPAFSYTWDGLYRGRSVVFAHDGNIIMASVQWMDASDQTIDDFGEILDSLRLF